MQRIPQITMPFLMCYDTGACLLSYEYIKLTNEAFSPNETRVLNLVGQCIEASKMRNGKLIESFN